MKYLYIIPTLIFSLFLICIFNSNSSFAQCISAPNMMGGEDAVCTGVDNDGFEGTPNPDMITVEVGAQVTTPAGPPINLLQGNNTFIINGGLIENGTGAGNIINSSNGDDIFVINGGTVNGNFALNPSSGNDNVTVNDGMINGQINLSSGNDTYNMFGGSVTSNLDAINASSGIDNINIFGGSVTGGTDGNGDGVNLASDNDTIFVSNATVSGIPEAINGGGGNDNITMGAGAVINGLLDCGTDFDIITFAMAVPTNQVAALTAEIESLNPAGDSIIINDLFYEWEDCEELVAQLEGGFATPVPTLSQWGLIMMAALIGVFAVITARRRFQIS